MTKTPKQEESDQKVHTLLDKRTNLKASSLRGYVGAIRRFSDYCGFEDGFELVTKDIDDVENLMEDWIRGHEDSLAPKNLNLVYCAIKKWCKINRLIKSTKMFREIDFDKHSRKTSALTERMITTKHVKQAFDVSPVKDKIDLGWYSLVGLRPSLIPQLKALCDLRGNRCGFHERSAQIVDGKLKIIRKPALYIITRLNENGERRQGNKANIDFFTFVPTKLCELIETYVNMTYTKVTPTTPVSDSKNTTAIYYKIKSIFKKVKFEGRPYLLRKIADRLLDELRKSEGENDPDLKEFLMGHKGKISGVYQFSGLTDEDEQGYRKAYKNFVEKQINLKIFGTVSTAQLNAANAIVANAIELGVTPEQLEGIRKSLEIGKITFEQFNRGVVNAQRQASEAQLDKRIELILAKRELANQTTKP